MYQNREDVSNAKYSDMVLRHVAPQSAYALDVVIQMSITLMNANDNKNVPTVKDATHLLQHHVFIINLNLMCSTYKHQKELATRMRSAQSNQDCPNQDNLMHPSPKQI